MISFSTDDMTYDEVLLMNYIDLMYSSIFSLLIFELIALKLRLLRYVFN